MEQVVIAVELLDREVKELSQQLQYARVHYEAGHPTIKQMVGRIQRMNAERAAIANASVLVAA